MITSNNIENLYLEALKNVLCNGYRDCSDPDIFVEMPLVLQIQDTINIDLDISLILPKLFLDYEEQLKNEIDYYTTTFNVLKGRVVSEIMANPNSRKLYFNLWSENDNGLNVKSPCLVGVYFRVFENKLNMEVVMRANNAFRISLINLSIFISFFKEVAQLLNLDSGAYIHFAASYHIYKKDLSDMINNNYLISKNITI